MYWTEVTVLSFVLSRYVLISIARSKVRVACRGDLFRKFALVLSSPESLVHLCNLT